MKRQIPGLHFNQHGVENTLEGLFLVRVERAQYRWRPQKPFVEFRFGVLEPKSFEGRSFSGRLYCDGKSVVATQLASQRFWIRRATPQG